LPLCKIQQELIHETFMKQSWSSMHKSSKHAGVHHWCT